MKPTLQQLDLWLDAYNMAASLFVARVIIELCPGEDPSHHIMVEREPDESDEDLLCRACAVMAKDCCLVSPLVALHLSRP